MQSYRAPQEEGSIAFAGETIGILLSRLAKQSSSAPENQVIQQIWQDVRKALVATHRDGQDDRYANMPSAMLLLLRLTASRLL